MSAVGLIDAGGANLGSVRYALERLGVEVRMVREPSALEGVQRVVLPGVGAAAEGMRRLHAQGLVQPLRGLQVPLMGICLGMQLLFERSEEGDVECLGLLPGIVRRLHPAVGVRVPHMGWNKLLALRESSLLDGVAAGSSAYFVHSYAAPVTSDTVAACHHGGLFTAVVQRGRLCGAQFHPERSAGPGARILRNFIENDFS
ncbi:imidazole glycerol phosphate synthase, glutamine amidotransferase subunit with HisF [uncultured Stenotrophomonas sp.]|uniref:Imidazole glycerol phosphate synthase subunit HisH n=1 Tax=uncultured Stenotrophomonas sp. TaxID=165438 RepID=A0A1Y5Q637_9GAMM|nr:imidazole glycerol phosphate synthase, glutamine amidotransferase subunit with HisF [uncultured Stenotrophomonas sp.]